MPVDNRPETSLLFDWMLAEPSDNAQKTPCRPSYMRRGFEPTHEPYHALVRFKSAFVGGSERELVARALDAGRRNTSPEAITSILDIGASDCRNTAKILEATQGGLNSWSLATLDPDDEAIAHTPPQVCRQQHVSGVFQKLAPGVLKLVPHVILFSHSLYYFPDPVDTLTRALSFLPAGGRVVVSMWDHMCDLRALASKVAVAPCTPWSAQSVYRVLSEHARCDWVGTWRGSVDFDVWRESSEMSEIARAILAPRAALSGAVQSRSLQSALRAFPRRGNRQNSVFTIRAPA